MFVIDDYLERSLFVPIRDALEAATFPWEESQILSSKAATHLRPDDNLQHVHGFYLKKPGVFLRSEKLDLIRPIIERLNPVLLIKAKANRTARKARHIEYGLHVDTSRRGATTAIFYLNSNNGYTLFADGTKVDSVENRIVLFDAATPHTGASCTDADARLVLNINMVLAPHVRAGGA
ncbi:hypothetical protein [Massilia glaciei]|nr:hypothetical protein [Massilia glaciei]